jgi:DnaJ-class molecular chaperone
MQLSREASVSYTYYDYLDLSPGASPARIETAFLGLLERYRYGASDSGQDMSGLVAMVQTAYQVLSNPETRARYDASLAREAAMADAELKAALDQHDASARHRRQEVPDTIEDAFAAIAA